MLDDLEFLVGRRESLTGQAILFTTNRSGTDNPFNPLHPAVAVATDPSELLDILSALFPFPEEMRDVMHQKLRLMADLWRRTMFGQQMFEAIQELKDRGLDNLGLPPEAQEQLRAELASLPDEPTGSAHHGFALPLVGFDPDLVEGYKSTVDLARAPDVPNVSFAGLVLQGHAQHYLAAYLLQSEEAAGRETPEASADAPHFRDLSRDDFLALLEKKVSEIMYAEETGADAGRALGDLVRMTSGTLFLRDVLHLSRAARTFEAGRRVRAMELYLKRIQLLALERYEEIPALDRRLAEVDPGR